MSSAPVGNSHKDTISTLESPPEDNLNASSESSIPLSHHSEISEPVNITTPDKNNTGIRETCMSSSTSLSHESKTFFSTPSITTINNNNVTLSRSSSPSSLLLWSPRSQHSPSRMSGDFVECVSPSPVHPESSIISKLEESEWEEQDEYGPLPLHTIKKDSVVSEVYVNEKSNNTYDNGKSKRETNDYDNEYSATEREKGRVKKEEKAQMKSDAMFSSSPTESCTPHTLSLSTSSLSLLTSSTLSAMQPSSSLHNAKKHNDKGSIENKHHLHRKQKEDIQIYNSRKSKNEYLRNARDNNIDKKMSSNTNSFTSNEEQANVNTSVTPSSCSNSVNNVKESREKSHNKTKSSTSTQNNSKFTNEYTSTVSSLLLEPFPHSRVLSVCLVHDTLLTTHHSGICLYKEKDKKQQEVNTCHNKNTSSVKCNDVRVNNNNKALHTSFSSSLSSPSHSLSKKETQEEYYYYGYGVWELVETRNEMYWRDAYLSTPALYPTISQLPTCKNNKNTVPLHKVIEQQKENVKSQLENKQSVTTNNKNIANFNKSDTISYKNMDNSREMEKKASRLSSTVLSSSSLPHPYARFFALACGNDHSGHSVCVSSTAGHFMLHHNLHNQHKIVALHFTLIPLEPLHTTNTISQNMKVKPLVVSVDEIGQIALFDIDRNHYALVRNCPEPVLTLMQQESSNKNNNNKETEKASEEWCARNKNIKENIMHSQNTLHTMHQIQDMEGFEDELTQELLIAPHSLDALPPYQLENGMAVSVSCTGPCLQLCNECRNLFCGISGSDYYVQEEKEKLYDNEVKDVNEYKCKGHTNTHNTFMALNLFISCRGRDVQEYEEKELEQEETQKGKYVKDNTIKDIARHSNVNDERSAEPEKRTTGSNNEAVALDKSTRKCIAEKDNNAINEHYGNNAHMYVNFIRVVWNGNRHCFALQEHSILHDTMPVSIAEHGHAMCVRYCANNKIQNNMRMMQREYRNVEKYDEFLRSRVWLACAKMKWAELTSCTGQVKTIYNVNKVHLENELCTSTNKDDDDKDKCKDEHDSNSIIIQWIPLGMCALNSKRSKEMRKTKNDNTKTKSSDDSRNTSKNTKHVYSELEEYESQQEDQEDIMYDCVVAVTSELDILLLGKQVDASFLHEICNPVQSEPGEEVKREHKEQEELKIDEEESNLEVHNMKEAENHELEEHVQNKKEWEQLLPNSVDAEAEEERAKLEAWLAEDDNDSKDSHSYSQDETSHSFDDTNVNAKEQKEEEESSFQEGAEEHVCPTIMNFYPIVSSAKDVSCIDANNNCKKQIKHEEENVVLGLNSKQGEDVHSVSTTVATTSQNVDDVVHKDHVSVQEKAITNKTNDDNDVKCSCINEEDCKSTEVTNKVEQLSANKALIDICTVQDVKHNMKGNNFNINNSKEQELQCYELIATLYTSNQSLSMQSLKSHSTTHTNMQNQKRTKRKCYNSFNIMVVMLEHKRSETHPSFLLYHYDTMSLQRIILPFIQFAVHASESKSNDNNDVLYNTAEQNRLEEELQQHNSSSFLSLHPSELSESVKELMWKSTQHLMSNWMSLNDNKSNDNNDKGKNSNNWVVNHVFASPASMLPSWSMPFHLPHAQQPTSSQFTGVVQQEAEKQENKSKFRKEEEHITSQGEHKSDSDNTMFDLNIGRPLANLMFGWVDKSHMDKEKEINNKKREDSNNTHYTNNNSSNNNLHVESTSNTSGTLEHLLQEEKETECTMSRESKLQNTLSTYSSFLYRHSHSPSSHLPTITQTGVAASASSCLPPSSEVSSPPLKKRESNVLPRVVESPPHVQTSSLTMAASFESLPSTGASASFWSSSASPHSQDSHRKKNKKKKNRVKVISINLNQQNNKSNDDVLEHSLQSNIIKNSNIEDKAESTSHSKEVKEKQFEEKEEELIQEEEQKEVDRDKMNNNEILSLSPLSFTTKRSDVESDEQSRHMKSARSTSLFAEISKSASSLSLSPLPSSALSPDAMDKCTVKSEHNSSNEDEHYHKQIGADVSNSNLNNKEDSMVDRVNNVSPEQSTNISHNTINIEVMSSYLLMTQLCNVHEPISRHRLYSNEEKEFHTILLTCSVEEENVHEYEVHEHAKQKEEHHRRLILYKRLVLQDMFVNSAINSGTYSSTKAGTSSPLSSPLTSNKLTGASLSLSDKCHASSQFASQFVSWRTERMANHNKANLFDFNSYFHSLIVPTQIHELQERDKCKYELEDLRQVQQTELSALPSPFDVIVIYQNEEKASSSLLSWSVYDANDINNNNENEKNTKNAREKITQNQSWEPHRTFPFDDEAGQVIDLPRLNATAVVSDKFASYKNVRNKNSSSNDTCSSSNEEWRWATEQEVKRIENDESLIAHKANCGKAKQKMKMKMMMQSLNKDLLHWNVSPWEYAPHWPSTNNSYNNSKITITNNNSIINNENNTKIMQNTSEHQDECLEKAKESVLPIDATNIYNNDDSNNKTENKSFEWSLEELPSSRVRRRRLERVRVNIRLLEQREKLITQHQQQLQALQMELGL